MKNTRRKKSRLFKKSVQNTYAVCRLSTSPRLAHIRKCIHTLGLDESTNPQPAPYAVNIFYMFVHNQQVFGIKLKAFFASFDINTL
jgi:hypothetical protein